MGLPEVIRFIGETIYRSEINELSTKYSDINLVEMATTQNLAKTYQEILGFCKGELRLHVADYLRKWDVWNVKTLLRGKSYGATPDDIMEDIVPAGALRREFFLDLANKETLETTVEGLRRTPYHGTIMHGLGASGELDLLKIENALDRDYYSLLLCIECAESKWVTRLLNRFFRGEIDVTNLKTLFKLKFEGLEGERIMEFLIPGGLELRDTDLKQLALTESYKAFVNDLQKYKFYESIRSAVEGSEERKTINSIIMALEQAHIVRAEKFGKIYPLSPLPIMDYFIKKRIEVDNLRIICRAKHTGLSEEMIKEMLIM
jgi:V/A-type H+-transporting ATPase subunit C